MVITVFFLDPKKSINRPVEFQKKYFKKGDATIFFKEPVFNLNLNISQLFQNGSSLNYLYAPANLCTSKFINEFDLQIKEHANRTKINYFKFNNSDELNSHYVAMKSKVFKIF